MWGQTYDADAVYSHEEAFRDWAEERGLDLSTEAAYEDAADAYDAWRATVPAWY